MGLPQIYLLFNIIVIVILFIKLMLIELMQIPGQDEDDLSDFGRNKCGMKPLKNFTLLWILKFFFSIP